MKKLSIAKAINEAIDEEMDINPKVICLGEDIGITGGWGGPFTVTKGLSEKYGHERIIDTPISESAIIGSAVGVSLLGFKPITEVQYSDFLFCAMDQIVNQAAKIRFMSGGKNTISVIIRAPVGATSRGAQHAQTPAAFFCHVPGITVVVPSTPQDAKGLMKNAIRSNGVILFLEHKLLYGGGRLEKGAVEQEEDSSGVIEEITPFGKGIIRRKGKDLTIVATLLLLKKTIKICQRLYEKKGIDIEIIDPRTLVPLDIELIDSSVKKTKKLMIVDEDNGFCSWSSELSSIIYEKNYKILCSPVKKVTTMDIPIPCSPDLEKYVIPGEEKIEKEILDMLNI